MARPRDERLDLVRRIGWEHQVAPFLGDRDPRREPGKARPQLGRQSGSDRRLVDRRTPAEDPCIRDHATDGARTERIAGRDRRDLHFDIRTARRVADHAPPAPHAHRGSRRLQPQPQRAGLEGGDLDAAGARDDDRPGDLGWDEPVEQQLATGRFGRRPRVEARDDRNRAAEPAFATQRPQLVERTHRLARKPACVDHHADTAPTEDRRRDQRPASDALDAFDHDRDRILVREDPFDQPTRLDRDVVVLPRDRQHAPADAGHDRIELVGTREPRRRARRQTIATDRRWHVGARLLEHT